MTQPTKTARTATLRGDEGCAAGAHNALSCESPHTVHERAADLDTRDRQP